MGSGPQRYNLWYNEVASFQPNAHTGGELFPYTVPQCTQTFSSTADLAC